MIRFFIFLVFEQVKFDEKLVANVSFC